MDTVLANRNSEYQAFMCVLTETQEWHNRNFDIENARIPKCHLSHEHEQHISHKHLVTHIFNKVPAMYTIYISWQRAKWLINKWFYITNSIMSNRNHI